MNSILLKRIENVSIPSKKAVTKTLTELNSNQNHVVVPHFIFATAGYHGIGPGSIFESGILRTSTSRHSGTLNPLFPSLKSSRTSKFASMASLVGGHASEIQKRSLRTELRNSEIQDGEDEIVHGQSIQGIHASSSVRVDCDCTRSLGSMTGPQWCMDPWLSLYLTR